MKSVSGHVNLSFVACDAVDYVVICVQKHPQIAQSRFILCDGVLRSSRGIVSLHTSAAFRCNTLQDGSESACYVD